MLSSRFLILVDLLLSFGFMVILCLACLRGSLWAILLGHAPIISRLWILLLIGMGLGRIIRLMALLVRCRIWLWLVGCLFMSLLSWTLVCILLICMLVLSLIVVRMFFRLLMI